MKHLFSALLAVSLLLGLLSGCRAGGPDGSASPAPAPSSSPSLSPAPSTGAEPSPSVSGLSVLELAVIASEHSGREDQDSLERLDAAGDLDLLTAYAQNVYLLKDPWTDMAVIRAAGASAFEIVVAHMEDDSAAVRAATAFMNYTSSRRGDFVGYAPAEADMVAKGEILQSGPYAALFICPDPAEASAALEAALSGAFPPVTETEPVQESQDPAEQTSDVQRLRDLLVSNRGMEDADLELLDGGSPEALRDYVQDVYGLSRNQWTQCAIARDRASAFEIAVMRAPNNWDVTRSMTKRLSAYLDAREGQFTDDEGQRDMLHQAIAISGATGEDYSYVVLLACQEAQDTALYFSMQAPTYGFSWHTRYQDYPETDPDYPGRCKFTQPNVDDMSLYDTAAIRSAWETGDPSPLSGYDRAIYDSARQVLDQVLEDGMSDLEKETAVYQWMVSHVNYDWTHGDRLLETPRASFTPYGGLVEHKAVCLGFATTFQLLMDLSGVECATVVGASHQSRSDHSWNMVRLNGEWYCVDVTWDANARENGGRGQPKDWDYFNVTSEDMASSDHQWDYANIPEATAEDRGRA